MPIDFRTAILIVFDEQRLAQRQQDAGDNGPITVSRFDVVPNQIIVCIKGSLRPSRSTPKRPHCTMTSAADDLLPSTKEAALVYRQQDPKSDRYFGAKDL